MALLAAVLDVVQKEYKKKEPFWKKQMYVTKSDLDFLETECIAKSEFDPFGWRRVMLDRFKKGTAPMDIRTCEYGSVLAILDHDNQTIPWGLWGRILRIYQEKNAKPARIFFLATPYLREFPKGSRNITPDCINGGYTYHCNKETIMIYRAEDATRVLIHELQHATCLDHMDHGVDHVEAETEAWAELLYVAMLSQGKQDTFYGLVKKQGEWMTIQNEVVKRHLDKPTQFPWRYTIGKEEVWKRWGIVDRLSENTAAQYSLRRNVHPGGKPSATHSLRLTAPPSDTIQKQFGTHSTIL
jgi:hypothetical protein